ncbi:MAG TPA: hypothetical protein VI277_07870 [Candidatus Limnocylindria bacterium]
MPTDVIVEVAPKRAFASALAWPGWSRGGTTPDDAVGALTSYAPRYAVVAKRAKIAFAPGPLTVVERVAGGAGTEFGVPGAAAASEDRALRAAELKRLVSLLEAAWATFDAAAARAVGVELSKGPRGGGRDLDKIIGHVREADVAYLGQLGSRSPAAADENAESPMQLLRLAFVEALGAVAAGRPVADPRNTRKPWLPRYTIRRSAWHVLDHAWEIEDRAG